MKIFALFAFLAVSVLAREDADLHKAFLDFMSKYGKTYPHHEHAFRFEIFSSNVNFINAHNSRNESYKVAINQFADLTNAEYQKLYLGVKQPLDYAIVEGERVTPRYKTIPPTFDWRTKGAVTPVKNQGQCGSCWSFSTTGSTEGCHFLKTGKLVSLSEQNLMDCSTSEGNQGCNGGLMTQAMDYIIKNKGVDTESSYPYTARDGTCHFKTADVGATLANYTNIKKGDENELLNAATVGPVSVAIDAALPGFQFYHSGVYYSIFCSSTKLDHGVLVAGWGTDDGKDYWLVKNSWGASWGMQGYIQMSRNRDNNCGIATSATLPHC